MSEILTENKKDNAAAPAADDVKNGEPILSVQNLEFEFTLRGQTLHALRGISLDVYKGESLAIVGESGSGKSVFVSTLMGLNAQNGRITGGKILYHGKDITKYKTNEEWKTIRGAKIAMVMQDPMTSLNPLKTIGFQIQEAVELHQHLHGEAACGRELSSQLPSPAVLKSSSATSRPLRSMSRSRHRSLAF